MSKGTRRLQSTLMAAALSFTVAAAARLALPPHGDRSLHDLAGVLSNGTVETLESRHGELNRKTGVALVMLTVRSLQDETLSDFAVRVGSEWGVGKKGQDRGIVVAFTTDEPHVFVATGYGVEGFLPDGRVGAILDRDVVPALRARDFDRAVTQLSDRLVAACAAEFGVTIGGIEPAALPSDEWAHGLPPFVYIALLVVVFLVFRSILFSLGGGRRRMWYGGGFGGGGFGGGSFGGGGGGFGGFGGGGFGGGGAGR